MSSARGLPDQNEAKRTQNGAVSRPLDLIDHEACLRPGNHARPLTDPQKTDGKREQAYDQKRSAHDFFPPPSPGHFGRVAFFMMAAETFAMGNRSFRSIATPGGRAEPRSPMAALGCPRAARIRHRPLRRNGLSRRARRHDAGSVGDRDTNAPSSSSREVSPHRRSKEKARDNA